MAVVLRSCGGKASLKRDSRFFRQSPVSSFFWMFWLLIEFGQVNWFSFIEVVDWPGQPLLDFFNVFMVTPSGRSKGSKLRLRITTYSSTTTSPGRLGFGSTPASPSSSSRFAWA